MPRGKRRRGGNEVSMNVTWLTARYFGKDLCATTQIELSLGLVRCGVNLTVYSPGKFPASEVQHISIPRSKIKGRQSASIVKNLKPYIKKINQSDCVLLDWKLSSLIPKITTKLILIDRGPPADRGYLSMLQMRVWKRGWKSVKHGCVVSEQHKKFVESSIPNKSRTIAVLPAGVNTQLFQKATRKGPIRLVYQGRIDSHRGIGRIIQLFESLNHKSPDGFELYFHGKGNMVDEIEEMNLNNVKVTRYLEQADLANRLANYDIGLLPMPKSKIWTLASPLKRSEYLGSGLLILGIRHEGHQIEGRDSDNYCKLYPENEFLHRAKEWLESLRREDVDLLQEKARAYAVKHLDWNHSIERLLEIMSS